MQVLIVEDEARVASFLQRGLDAEGYRCTLAADAESALQWLAAGDFDLILLDRMLPGRDGLSLCRQLRAQGLQTPILMLTALDAVEARVEGLEHGADDYLAKPFDFDELLARLRALARRAGLRNATDPATLRLGALIIDTDTREVLWQSSPVHLTALEFDLLALLASAPRRVFSRQRILHRVWGQTEDPLTNIVDVYVRRLRAKLTPQLIETVRGVGYRLRPPDTADEAAPS